MPFHYYIAIAVLAALLSGCGGPMEQKEAAVKDTPTQSTIDPVDDEEGDRSNDAAVSYDEVSNISDLDGAIAEVVEPTPAPDLISEVDEEEAEEEMEEIDVVEAEMIPAEEIFEEEGSVSVEDEVEVKKERKRKTKKERKEKVEKSGKDKKKSKKHFCAIFQDTKSVRLAKWIEEVENSKIEKKKKKDVKEPKCGDIITHNTQLSSDLHCSEEYPVALTIVGDGIVFNGKGHTITVPRKRTAILILGEENKVKNISLKGGKSKRGIVAYEEKPTNQCKKIKEVVPKMASMGFSDGIYTAFRAFFFSLKQLILQLFQ